MHIDLPSGFSLPETVVSHGWYRLPPFRWDEKKASLGRSELFGDKAVDLEFRARKRLTISSKLDLRPFRLELKSRVSRMLQLDVDLEAFHAICRRRKRHRDVSDRGYGRLLCSTSIWEDAVKIILTTNTTWGQTIRMATNLVERFGTKSASGSPAFPTPEQIAATDEGVLREYCRLGYRAGFVLRLARGLVNGSIDLDAIADPAQSSQDLYSSYRKLPGIGPYGAAHLLAMDGRHDSIAVDTEFRSHVREVHFKGREDVTDKEMLDVYRSWGKWKYLGYWSELWLRERG